MGCSSSSCCCARAEEYLRSSYPTSGLPHRKMVESPDSRVDFAFAEALAFGTLALHRGFRPPAAPGSEAATSAEEHPQARLRLAAVEQLGGCTAGYPPVCGSS